MIERTARVPVPEHVPARWRSAAVVVGAPTGAAVGYLAAILVIGLPVILD